jgi:transcriptional regulator with XRE-family HTH domain
MNNVTDIATFGKTIEMKRRVANLTQQDLARKASTTQQLISAIERGVISPQLFGQYGHIIRAIDHVLGVSSRTDSPEYEVWRGMVVNELDRQLEREDTKYNVYSQCLLNDDLMRSGAKERDVAQIVEELKHEGIIWAVAVRRCDESGAGGNVERYWIVKWIDRGKLDLEN